MSRDTRRRPRASAFAALAFVAGFVTLGAGAGCRGPMAKIESLRQALISGDTKTIREATTGYPTCTETAPVATLPGKPGPYDAGCLTEIATALGSKQGYDPKNPDHAAAATAALVIARDGRGDWLAHVDGWLDDLKNGRGTGHDTLRLAVAWRMADAAPLVGRRLDDESSARTAMKAVVGAVPGACPTYWLLGSSADPRTIPPELSADHAACVQKDLMRREGPGASYGSGTMRATEGALALWRETERALRMGLPHADAGPRMTLEKHLAMIEAATAKIETVKVESSPSVIGPMGDLHADAGVLLYPTKPDAGAPRPPLKGGP